MPPTFREDPYGGYNFVVIVNGVSDDGTPSRPDAVRCRDSRQK